MLSQSQAPKVTDRASQRQFQIWLVKMSYMQAYEGDSFSCNGSGREYGFSSSFISCYSSGVVYLLGCQVCGKQYVGSTVKPFRARFNNYKSASRRYDKGESVAQATLFRHITERDHRHHLITINELVVDITNGNWLHKQSFLGNLLRQIIIRLWKR